MVSSCWSFINSWVCSWHAKFIISDRSDGRRWCCLLSQSKFTIYSQNDLVEGEQGEMRLEGDGAKPEQIELSEIADNSPISIQLGYGLVDMVNEENGGTLVNRVTGIRRQVSKALGFVVPAVRIRDDLTLEANTYRLRIGQTIVGEDIVYPDRKLAIPGENASIKIEGIEVKDPTFGMDAVWIMEKDVLEAEVKAL